MDVPDFETMALERLEAVLTEAAGHLAAAECRFLLALAAYDRRDGWREWGCRTCADWLSWRCGIDLRTAQEKLRVAHALALFPRIAEEFAQGRLSYSKVRALTRMAGPDTVDDLVEMALRATAAHSESIARGYRRVERSVERCEPAADPKPRRGVHFVDDDGETVMIARLTEEEIELVRTALDAARKGVSRADALVMMAESFRTHGHGCRDGSDRATLVVNVDEGVLTGDDDTNWPRIDGGSAIIPETVRRLACDASFVWLLRGKDGEPINVSAKHGPIPRALRRLVRARDRGRCRFPSCDEHRYTDVHHLVHRVRGGPNTAANLVTLCWFHHRLVHEGGWSIARTERGDYEATNPAGVTIGAEVEPAPAHGSAESANRGHGVPIDASTAVPQWGGETLDLGWAVTSLWYANHPGELARFAEQARDISERAA